MKKATLIGLIVLCVTNCSLLWSKEKTSNTDWFEDARFGMFIHFGPYSVLGDGEWVMSYRKIKAKNYLRLQDFFNPQAYDAEEWVRIAKDAGMKYITFTSRHHDGFSNWDTKHSDWNIMNTPYGKDILKQLADACRKEDMKLVLYYSTIDWIREDYPWRSGRTGQDAGRTAPSDYDSYFDFMKNQLTELLTNYGDIAGIWFDGHWDQTDDKNRISHESNIDWRYPELYAHIKRLNPQCLIANNHHLPPFPGEDYQIFEQDIPGQNTAGHSGQEISRLPLETCQTINNTWGFNITDDNYKSEKELLQTLIGAAGRGANLLLNVGPMPNGKIQVECTERLHKMGEWMEKYGFTIYGTFKGFSVPQSWGVTTMKDKIGYIHILDENTSSITLRIPEFKSAKLLNTNVVLNQKKDKKTGEITFSIDGKLDEIDTIIKVVLK